MLLKIVDSLHFFCGKKTTQESAVAVLLTAIGHVVVWFYTPRYHWCGSFAMLMWSLEVVLTPHRSA